MLVLSLYPKNASYNKILPNWHFNATTKIFKKMLILEKRAKKKNIQMFEMIVCCKGLYRGRGRNGKMYEKVRRKSRSLWHHPPHCSHPDQTGLCVWFSFTSFLPRSPSLLPPLFFLSLEKVGGGRKRWQNSRILEVCPIPALNSAPQLLWFKTERVSVSLCLNHFPLHSGPPFLHISYQWPYHCLPSGGAGKVQQGEFTRRIMTKSPACILYNWVFLQIQIQWSTATSAQGKS